MARYRARLTVLIAITAVLSSATAGQEPRLDAIVERASAYVERYAADLRFVLADEMYSQRVLDARGNLRRERQMRGELYLAFLPADAVWIAVRDVADVDGTAVQGRDELQALLRQGEVTSVARRVADRNASFNIGSIARNFNEPTLPLLLLTENRVSRTRFRIASRAAGTITLSFEERERPPLVRGRTGAAVFSRGTIVVDVETGRVERTTLELDEAGIHVQLETTYAPNERLGLWVPVVFRERYEGASEGDRETIVCTARYANYRRFEVTGRIK